MKIWGYKIKIYIFALWWSGFSGVIEEYACFLLVQNPVRVWFEERSVPADNGSDGRQRGV